MRLLIVAVGRARPGPARTLFEEYRRRLAWPLDLVEVEERRPLAAAARRAREAEMLLAALPGRGGARTVVVALDEAGAALSSAELAARLGAWRDQGAGAVAFLVGGADGHGEPAIGRADLVLSLGRMTWPHMLVRVLLVEQLYRAQCILTGHPYHRA